MTEIPRENVWQMFDRIAHRYDFLNHFLSLGQDIRWRNRVADFIPADRELKLLDIATGTGDQIFSVLNRRPNIRQAVGIDLADNMLEKGRRKVRDRNLETRVSLQEGDADDLPFGDRQFDILTISFGIRNVHNVQNALTEMYRVLVPGGRLIVLEFSLPRFIVFRKLYLIYFRHILPFLGRLISGDDYAYRYLNETVETFPYGQDFTDILRRSGFGSAGIQALSFGIASIYHADKEKGNRT